MYDYCACTFQLFRKMCYAHGSIALPAALLTDETDFTDERPSVVIQAASKENYFTLKFTHTPLNLIWKKLVNADHA